MPRPPRRTVTRATGEKAKGARRIWVLREGQAVPVDVNVGATDGAMTEILSGELAAGTPVIVDTVSTG
jgi:HlyD family secretion protein